MLVTLARITNTLFHQPLRHGLTLLENLLENVQVYLLSHAVTRYRMIYFGNSSKIGICF